MSKASNNLWPAELQVGTPTTQPRDWGHTSDAIRLPLPELHPGQIAIEERLAGCRFGVVMAGRRAGKSTGPGIRWILEGLALGLRCAWLAPTNKILADAWRTMKRITRTAGAKVYEQEHRIVLGAGELECWSFEGNDPALSRSYDRMVIDEAGIVRNLMDKWQIALRATLVDRRGSARFLGTPRGMGSGFVQLWRMAEAGEKGWGYARIRTVDNPFIDPEEVEEARRQLPPEIFKQEFEGIPTESSLNPFGLEAIGRCIAELSPYEPRIWGWDFARAEDFTVGIALDLGGRVCRLERWNRQSWAEIRRRIAVSTGDVYAVGDSTGIGDVIVEDLQRGGMRLEPYLFSRPSKQALMQRLAAAIQMGTVQFPSGVIRQELEVFEYQTFGGSVRYTAPSGMHDDTVMSLALAVYGYDRLGLALQYEASKRAEPIPLDNWDPAVLARAALESRRIKERPLLRNPAVPISAIESID